MSFYLVWFFYFIGNLLKSSSTKYLVVLLFIAFYTAPLSSKHFFLGLFLRFLSTQLFFLVVLLLLLISMTAFSYVGFLSLFWVRLFHGLYLTHLPPSSFLEKLILFWTVCRARIRLLVSLFSSELFFGLLIFSVYVFKILQGRLHIISSFWEFLGVRSYSFVSLAILLISAILRDHFSYFSQGFFMRLLPCFFLVLFFIAGLHCLLRVHTLNSCVGDTWQRLWQDGFTHNGKQVVNRLKIPQGLSTLMFRRWSEVPSRGGVRGDLP